MLGDLAFGADHPLRGVSTVDDVTAPIASSVPGFADVTLDALAGARTACSPRRCRPRCRRHLSSAPGRNSYDYRLVVSRKFYDRAVGTAMSRSLAKLAPGPALHVHPLDLDSLGVADGGDVKIVECEGRRVLPIVADARRPAGVVWSPFNQGGGTIEDIIDAAAAITDVRIEVV